MVTLRILPQVVALLPAALTEMPPMFGIAYGPPPAWPQASDIIAIPIHTSDFVSTLRQRLHNTFITGDDHSAAPQ